jgi:uncharacterized protein (DUF433 family)
MNTTTTTVQGVVTAEGALELKQALSLPPGPVEITITAVAAGENGRTEPQQPKIIDRGRGPEILGTRITVYDVLDYYKHGWHHSSIAIALGLASDQVLAAIHYVDEHKAEVWAKYRVMLERDAQANPPDLQAKLDALVANSRALRANCPDQEPTPEVNGEGNPGRQ